VHEGITGGLVTTGINAALAVVSLPGKAQTCSSREFARKVSCWGKG